MGKSRIAKRGFRSLPLRSALLASHLVSQAQDFQCAGLERAFPGDKPMHQRVASDEDGVDEAPSTDCPTDTIRTEIIRASSLLQAMCSVPWTASDYAETYRAETSIQPRFRSGCFVAGMTTIAVEATTQRDRVVLGERPLGQLPPSCASRGVMDRRRTRR